MAPLADDEEMTELVDADFPRVDLVGKGANGIPRFLVMKQDEASAGLMDPEFVRSLIGKQADEPSGRERVQTPSGITVSGSPADIAAFIHKAAQRAAEAEPDDVAKAKNDTADRKHKAATGAAMPDGSYPIADEGDLMKAIHAVGRGGSSHDAIRKHIISRARSLGASSKIPDNWNSDGSLKSGVSKEAGMPDAVTKDMGPELDDGVDQMDPTVPLCAPDDDMPGDPTDPGSPAWEAIDAATAQKWTSIAVRLKNALCVLAEREMLEAASADPGDCENAFDLQDAMCAVDYVIDTLAGFAVDEQAEADLGGEAMEMVGKSAPDPDTWAAITKAMEGADATAEALTKLETFGAVIAKSGRVLSSVNEAHIREAATRLNTVLASLPQAPTTSDDGQPVAKEQETAMAETPADPSAIAKDGQAASPDEQAKDTGPVNAGGTNGMGSPKEGAKALPGDAQTPGRQVIKAAEWCVQVYDRSRRFVGLADPDAIVRQVAKADDGEKKPMQAVFDQDGDLIGIVDPDAIQPVTGAGGPSSGDDTDPDGDGTGAAAPADAATDMTPAPPAETGTPADAPPDDDVAKQDQMVTQDVLKSIVAEAIAAALGTLAPAQDIAKQADVAGLSEQVETLKARLAQVEEQPAVPKVFTSGAVPPAHQMRGQDQGAPPIDVAKATQRKREFYTAPASEQNRIAGEMQQEAIDALASLHASRRPA